VLESYSIAGLPKILNSLIDIALRYLYRQFGLITGVLMNIKKFIIPAILISSPYVISNYLVFVFLVPILGLLYSNTKIKSLHFFFFTLITAGCVLLPILAYDPGVYMFGVIIVTTFVTTFLIVSGKLINRSQNTRFSIFIPSFIWIVLIYVLNFRSIAISAFDIGILFPASAPLIWYTGSIGLTLLIILFNSALARYFTKKDKFSLITAILLMAIFLFSHVFSLTRAPGDLHNLKKTEKVALIQGDVPRDSIFCYTERLEKRISRYIDLSEKAAKEKPDLIVWPEYTFPVDVMNEFPDKMQPVIDEIMRTKACFIIGSLLIDQTEEKRHYNSVLVFRGDGTLGGIYYARSPAPFNRNIRLKHMSEELYQGNIGITLCWEELNSGIFRDYVSKGAEYFISLSSNTDLDHFWFKRYTSFFSRARAAENMRYLARVTQTGITQIIDPFGKVVRRLPSNCSTFLIGEVYGIQEKTFYSVYGDVFTKTFVIFVLLYVFIGMIGKRLKREKAVRT